jgi:hypothetical protein
MSLTDQHGMTSCAWFPPGTPTDPSHLLPAPVYAEVCRRVGVAPSSPWVAYKTRAEALTAMAGAWLTVGTRAAGAHV